MSFAGALSGSGKLVKQGGGTLSLTGTGSSQGSVDVVGGTLAFLQTGPFSVTGNYETEAGATTNIGQANSTLRIGGAFSQSSNSTLEITLGSSPDIIAQRASLSGSLVLHGITLGAVPIKASELEASTYTVIHTSSGITGTFDTLGLPASGLDYLLDQGFVSSDGRDYDLGFQMAWTQGGKASGTGSFTLGAGTGFDVDFALTDQAMPAGGFDSGWDGRTLTKNGDGVLVLSAVNGYTGATIVNNGILRARVENAFAASSDLVLNGGTLDLNGYDQLGRRLAGGGAILLNGGILTVENAATVDSTLYAGVIADGDVTGGGLVKTGTGALTLTGDNTYSGLTTIASGTLQIGNGAASGSIAGDTVNNGVLVFNHANALAYDGTISGNGAVQQVGSGITTLSGTNTYSGETLVSAGTLQVNGDQSAATGLLSVAAGATLSGAGIIGSDVAIASSGTLAPGHGPGTLTINGGLSLSDGSILDYEFGEANVAGGSLNDLTVVKGNLLLDGTLNVTVPTGGNFATGIYRIFDYGGTLTDNGLALGAIPSTNVYLETSQTGQVNLVNTAGLAFGYWDGVTGPKFSGTIDGGNGAWQSSTGNDNWTEATGAINGTFNDGAFAVFMGAPGTVKIDTSLGAVRASGMQFLVDGYNLTGDTLTLTGPRSEIRVGDGTAAGANYSATIAAELSGTAELAKTDLGTLILSGTNSYNGGTAIEAGTLQLGSGGTTGSILGDVADNGVLAFNRSDTANFAGTISGSGGVIQLGSGTTVLSGMNSYGGATVVEGGTLQAGNANSFSAASAHSVAAGATLALSGFNQTILSLTNAGTVRLAAGGTGAPGTVLNVTGNYVGQGGTLVFNVRLGGDDSVTDLLRIAGNSSGTSQVRVINVGGLGAQTGDGIKLITVGGISQGTFNLLGDYVTSTGQQAVVAGAYAYTLNHNGKADPNDGNWYLRSELINPVAPDEPTPLFNPGTPLYESYPQVLLKMSSVATLRQRVSNRLWLGGDGAVVKDTGIWGRFDASFSQSQALHSTTGASRSGHDYTFTMGADTKLADTANGSVLMGGISARYGTDSSGVHSIEGTGTIRSSGVGLGASLTWYDKRGFYADFQAQYGWYDTDLSSQTANEKLAESNKGRSTAISLETGWTLPVGAGLKLIPQAQLSFAQAAFKSFSDPFGARISLEKSESLRARLGLTLDRETERTEANGKRTNLHVFAIANLYYEFLDGSQVRVTDADGLDPVLFTNREDRLWGGLGAGGVRSWNDDAISLFAEANFDTSLASLASSFSISGRLGARIKW